MADEEFAKAVSDGLRLSKRIYTGKDRAVTPPKPVSPTTMMAKPNNLADYLPTSLMVYEVIGNPAIVDNPDIPSYQPHVHGRCDPPALSPLQMNGIALHAICYLELMAFVTVEGSWRVHCVMGSKRCDCRVSVPMGEQGSILGVEVDTPRRSHSTQLVGMDDRKDPGKVARVENGGFLKPLIYTFTIPQVDGGSNLSIKVRWSQSMVYRGGQFTLDIPFNFLEYVTPAGKKVSKKEKIHLNVNSGPETEFLRETCSHPLKEIMHQVGRLSFVYESEVQTWSSSDFIFSYSVSLSHIFGSVLLQSPSVLDIDQRKMFYFHLFPGEQQSRKVFRKEVVFVVDISGSMRGKPLEDTKSAMLTALLKLDPEDSFNVIGFNGETYLFSSSLELTTKEAIENVTQWISTNIISGGGTNILLPLKQAIEMLSKARNCVPIIFLITDGAVEDERHICDIMKSNLKSKGSISPLIHTFGIGSFCNHYFLRMLAMIGRGYYDAAYDTGLIKVRMKGLFARASSTILSSIVIDNLNDLDDVEMYPSRTPDLSSESQLIISGRYHGEFPEKIKARGMLADMTNFTLDLKAQEAKDVPLDKVLAKQQIDLLTAQAWFTEDKELEEKVAKISVQNGIVSEYTRMILMETERGKKATESDSIPEVASKSNLQQMEDSKSQKIIVLRNLGVGFGNSTAMAENISPGSDDTKIAEPSEIFVKAASNCCGKLCQHCCCMCCIQNCSQITDQFAIALTQFCGALACLGCFSCCEACCSGSGG